MSDSGSETPAGVDLDVVLSSYPFGGTVALFDSDCRYLMVRGQGWDELGLDPRTFNGKTFEDLWPSEVAATLRGMAEVAFGGGTQIRRVPFDGHLYEMVAVPLHRGEGFENEGMFFSRDVTKESNWEALRSHLLDEVPIAVAAVDLEGRIMYWNPQSEELMGFSAEEVLGKSRYEIESKVLRPEAHGILAKLEEGDDWEAELPIVDAAGRPRTVFFRSTVIQDERGERVGVMGIAQDMTERHEMEERLQRMGRLDSLGRLAGGIAHDFNNILMVLSGSVDLLEMSATSPVDARVVQDIRESVRRGSELTRQLLAFGSADPEAPGVCDAVAVMGEVRKMMARLLPEELEFRVLTDLEQAPVPLQRGRLEQILVNLIMNARDATPATGWIELTATAGRRDTVIRVSDSGHGIPDDVRSRIFEPFVTGRKLGTGLGLATVYGLVTQVGGSIEVVESGPSGTTFEVRLPVASRVTDRL